MTRQECVAQLQEAVNLLTASSKWDDEAAMKAHTLGLQGEKRLERHSSRKCHMLVQHYRHIAYDLFDVVLEPEGSAPSLNSITDIKSYLESYIEKSWATYKEAQTIANALVVGCYKPLSCELYELADCLQKDIVEARRLLKEYVLAKEQYHHISRYEVSYRNVHDIMEAKEKSEGYDFD